MLKNIRIPLRLYNRALSVGFKRLNVNGIVNVNTIRLSNTQLRQASSGSDDLLTDEQKTAIMMHKIEQSTELNKELHRLYDVLMSKIPNYGQTGFSENDFNKLIMDEECQRITMNVFKLWTEAGLNLGLEDIEAYLSVLDKMAKSAGGENDGKK